MTTSLSKVMKVKRLPNWKWDIVRKRIYRRDKGVCQKCGCSLSLEEAEADHIVALVLGGTNEDSNIEIKCNKCHKEKTKRDVELNRRARFFRR